MPAFLAGLSRAGPFGKCLLISCNSRLIYILITCDLGLVLSVPPTFKTHQPTGLFPISVTDFVSSFGSQGCSLLRKCRRQHRHHVALGSSTWRDETSF